MPQLSELLSDAALSRYAGPRAFQRGVDYYRHGHVESVQPVGDGFRATVRGQRTYRVTFSLKRGALDYYCTCPMGVEGDFCKHCVASSLAWRSAGSALPKRQPPALKDARKVLAAMPSAAIAKLLLEWAKDDKLLEQRLLKLVADANGPQAAAAAVLNAIRDAEGDHYAASLAIDEVENLLEDGHAAIVVDLCEAALRVFAEDDTWELEEWEDEEDHVGDLTTRLGELHLRACREAAIDPVALAQRLYELEFDEDIDEFYLTPESYGELLGPAGWIAFRKLAEEGPHRTNRHTRDLLQSIARATGDTDWLIRLMSANLDSASKFTYMIEHLRKAKRDDEAFVWIERGIAAFSTDVNLRALAIEEYQRRGDHTKAMKLAWASYSAYPGPTQFVELQRHASLAGEWPEWRDNAIGLIRKQIAATKGGGKPDHSRLVELFLAEKNEEAAWREANTGGCSSYLWLRLAELREKDHPGDAAPIYLRAAEQEIVNARASDYQPAVDLLRRAAKVMKHIGAAAQFVREVDALRAKYKARRNFIKLLDSTRL